MADSNLITRNTDNPAEMIERNGKHYISGYGSIYYDGTSGTEYHLGGNVWERVQSGAFDKNLARRDNVKVRMNHDENFVLGELTEGTAEFSTDTKGLRYDVPFCEDEPDHVKTRKKIERHVIKGSSFAASGPKYRFSEDGEKHIAWLIGVEQLIDCAPVNSPAYKAAPAMMRSETLDKEYAEWLRRKSETEKRIQRLHKDG